MFGIMNNNKTHQNDPSKIKDKAGKEKCESWKSGNIFDSM